jgi:hypothetical protein
LPDPNIGQITASVFERVVARKPEDNVFLSQALLYFIKNGGGFSQQPGGSLIEETLEYAENTTFKSYSDLETLDTTRIDVFDAARFNWKEIAGTCVYSELEKQRAAGTEAKFDLIESKVKNARNSMFAVINRQMYSDGTGNGSKDIGGLALLISSTPTTGTVGGINRALFPFWRNRQGSGANSGTAYNQLRGAMRTSYNSCSKGAQDDHPDAMIFDQTSFEGYESTLTVNERFTTKAEGDGGFKNETMKFKGAKVTFDEDCPSGTGYTLNMDHIKFRYLVWAKAFPPVDPANQTAEVVKFLTIGNLSINNPRRLGVITSIT